MNIFDPTLIAPYFTFKLSTAQIQFSTDVLLCAADSSRVGLVLTGMTSQLQIAIDKSAQTAPFLLYGGSVTQKEFFYRDWGGLIGHAWWAFFNGSFQVGVLEIFYRPPSE